MSDKPVLFLLPGLMCDEAVWEHQQKSLAPHAEVIIPVFRGFNSLAAMADHVLAMAPMRFSLAGHSMGGRVAWEVMEKARDRIDKFAILDSGVHPVKPGEAEGRQVLLDKALSEGLQAVADAWVPPMVHPSRLGDEVLIQAINDMILRNSIKDFQGQVRALLERNDRTPGLSRITQHVLLIAGDADGWSPPEQHRDMAEKLASSHLEIVANAGHMVTMEKPEEVSTILLDWFTNNEA